MNNLKSFFTGTVLARLITAILLFLSANNFQIGYYKFLRWAVVSTAVYTIYATHVKDKRVTFGVWLFGIIALLFNPVFPFYLGKELWLQTDYIVGSIFIISIFFWRESKEY